MTYSLPTHTGTICKNRVITLFSCIFCIIRPYNRHFKALPVVPGGSNFAVTLTGVVQPGTNFNRNVMTYSCPTHTGTTFLYEYIVLSITRPFKALPVVQGG